MAPSPQNEVIVQEPAGPAGTEVVISGMAGLFPNSRYVRDLENILYNKLNPITRNLRWSFEHPEAAQYTGSIPGVEHFDAQFFKVHHRLGINMDAMSRKILEEAYEAVYDAGFNPEELSGKKVGVFIGTCLSETEKACFYSASKKSGFGIAGCSKAMFANRVSYWLNAKGPSLSIDGACCSSTVALEQAYLAIARGECEAAIAGGANLCLHPQSSVHYGRIMRISADGTTKSYDKGACGCSKSEAVNVLFLQKAKDARRIYARVVNAQSEYVQILDGETGPQYGFNRNPEDSAAFLKMFYDRAGIPPSLVEYVDGVGSAVPEVDKSELDAFDKIFCQDRKGPLMVGSVMSNIGYGEAASGISAVTKVLLAYHKGEIAGNLNCDSVRDDISAIQDGRIKILNDHSAFRRTFAAVNSLSVTGVNAHVLLHGHYKPKDLNRYKTNIPYLVTLSGRQDTSVQRAFGELKSQPIDPEQLALLQSIHQSRVNGHLGRGYAILDTKDGNTVCLSEKVEYYDDTARPLWFVYSGMGSQWAGMGAELMRIPIFSAAIERCRKALEPKGIDIVHIITSPEKNIFDNILHSFVGIAAVQIGLTDVLKELGLVPDHIIGHSVGELGCAYADGCLTAEEMILSAYSRGLVSLETSFIRGSMAAVGLGYQEMLKLCPPEIEIACHNSADSSTISGPADAMQAFVAELVAKGIFAKEVPCSNIAYHSRYISKAGPGLLKYLKEVIKTPKARSDKWVSTSVPKDRWEEEAAKYSSAEYHTNNLLSPVLFEETSQLIPSNAVLVEIAPHGLLQAILKRSLPDTCDNIPLTRRGHPDNTCMLLEAVGKLYVAGFLPKLQVLYPKVEFPVSTGTPFLSNLVDWAHHEEWPVPLYVEARRIAIPSCKFVVSADDAESSFLNGHVLDGQVMLPFSYILAAAWDTLAMTLRIPKKQLGVVFRDCHFFAMPKMQRQLCTNMVVSIQRGSGQFEVTDGEFKLACGYINSLDHSTPGDDENEFLNDDLDLNAQDVYRLLQEKGYSYSGQFRSIYSCNEPMTEANLIWNDNWVTFINGMIQLNALKYSSDNISEVRQIRLLTIDVSKHTKCVKKLNNIEVVKALSDNDSVKCGGVSIKHIQFRDLAVSKENQVKLTCMRFVPRYQTDIDNRSAIQVFIQMVSENLNKDIIKVIGIKNCSADTELFREMKEVAASNIPKIKIEYHSVLKNVILPSDNVLKDADLILVQMVTKDNELQRIIQCSTRRNIFVINEESFNAVNEQNNEVYKIISVLSNKDTDSRLELGYYLPNAPIPTTSVIVRSERDLPSLIATRSKLTPENSLVILTTYPPFSGLKSLVKHWRKDTTRNNVSLIMVNDVKNTKQLAKLPGDLAFNIFDKGIWGGVYYMPVTEKEENLCDIKLKHGKRGNLDSFKWVDGQLLNKSKGAVKVHYAGINRNDYERAIGAIPILDEDENKGFGLEFSGVTESGERVMGMVQGTAQSRVVPQPDLLWPVPVHWSLEDAATVPLAYVYAYYCLVIRLGVYAVKDSNKVTLVHGGSGALGQALISILLARGYEVFTTVSSQQKKKFLLRLFPELKAENVGNSRDCTFVDMILNRTNGVGCKYVFCCLSGGLKDISLNCVSQCGFMLDLVQIQKHETFSYGLSNLTKERTYITVDISSIFRYPNPKELKLLQMLVSDGIASGEVRPLSRVTYAAGDVARAFRLLAAAQHRGKVLLNMQDQQPAHTRFVCTEDEKHLIICDEQPLGTQIADILISAGAKNIHIHITKPSNYIGYKQRVWNSQGINVSISSEMLNDETSISKLLREINTSGPIHGIYLAADYCLKNTTLLTIDMTVSTICTSLKNFFMFGNGDDAAQFVSIRRAKEGLPATVLDLSILELIKDEDGLVWYHGIKEAIQKALLCHSPVVLGHIERPSTSSMIQKILGLFELQSPKDNDDNVTLKDLGIQQENIPAIASFFKDVHNISIDEEKISSLSIKRLKEKEEKIYGTKLEDIKGLGTFFSYVDPDELLATTEMVFLPTLTNNSTMRDDEFDLSQQFLCIVPGLEGHHERFRFICERLKLPAIVLQPGLDHLHETVQQLAQRYAQVLLKRTEIKNNFLLLGYETGVFVALELAAILEGYGYTGTVYCMGDGIEETKAQIKEQLLVYKNKEELQFALVNHMFTLMTGATAKNLEGLSWTQLVDTCVRTLLDHVPHSGQYARSQLESAYSRLTTTIAYNPNLKPLKSRIIVLRALSYYSSMPCTLQRFSQLPIVVQNLTVPLAHVVKDTRCSSIINEHLPKEILDTFNTKNICESYLLNANTFMETNN